MADGVGTQLSKKVGPLPVGVWVAVVVAGLGIGYFINRNQSTSDAPPPEQDPGVGTGGSGWSVVPPPPPETPVQQTNMMWAFKATNWLIAQGHPPTTAANAINKYVYSTPLTVEENALVNLVLKQFGAPPEPLPPVEQPKPPGGGEPPVKETAPPPVADLRSEPFSTSSVRLLWKKSEGATYYQVEGITGVSHSVITYDTNVVISWLEQGRSYTFRVRAGKGAAWSDWRSVTATVRGGGEYQPGPGGARKHIVSTGDTLWDIATQYYGNGFKSVQLYTVNSGVLEAAARAHGKTSARRGANLYVGTPIIIP